MKHYRSYMDRITAPARLRQRVLEAAEQGARPAGPPGGCPSGWRRCPPAVCWLWRAGGCSGWAAPPPSPTPPPAWPPPPPPAASSPAWEHTLTVGPGPFAEGEAHNFFDIPALNFPRLH